MKASTIERSTSLSEVGGIGAGVAKESDAEQLAGRVEGVYQRSDGGFRGVMNPAVGDADAGRSAPIFSDRIAMSPKASTEEVEMSMTAYARDLIGRVAGNDGREAVRQLDRLLREGTAGDGVQNNLRQFLYALHLTNVSSLRATDDPAATAAIKKLVDAFSESLKHGAALLDSPMDARQAFSGKLDGASKSGKQSYALWSEAWDALEAVLSRRGQVESGAASLRNHLNEYYKEQVAPRVAVRARFLYGGDVREQIGALLHSGSKEAAWRGAQALLTSAAHNPEERGLNFAAAAQLLHVMPEFLRRTITHPPERPPQTPEHHSGSRGLPRNDDERLDEARSQPNEANPNRLSDDSGSVRSGRTNINSMGDQTMIAPVVINCNDALSQDRHAPAPEAAARIYGAGAAVLRQSPAYREGPASMRPLDAEPENRSVAPDRTGRRSIAHESALERESSDLPSSDESSFVPLRSPWIGSEGHHVTAQPGLFGEPDRMSRSDSVSELLESAAYEYSTGAPAEAPQEPIRFGVNADGAAPEVGEPSRSVSSAGSEVPEWSALWQRPAFDAPVFGAGARLSWPVQRARSFPVVNEPHRVITTAGVGVTNPAEFMHNRSGQADRGDPPRPATPWRPRVNDE